MDIKNIIIFLGVFFLIMWLQHNDDKKFSKTDKRVSLYDKIKIPLVSAIFVILIKELDLNNCTNIMNSIIKPHSIIKSHSIIKPHSIIKLRSISSTPIKLLNSTKALDDIFIGPPDF